jgi:D-glycero-D-manno-heptose 1,7-bisphosphate phosphatase
MLMKVAFLDRDGVVNKDAGYTYRVDDFEFTAGCIDALKIFQEKNYKIIIVTNQSGIGRSYYSEDDYQKLTRWYCQQLLDRGITITDIFHCPHTPESLCACRKPREGLFLQAGQKYAIDFSSSFMVGDKISDLQAGHAAGVARLVLINHSGSKNVVEDVFVTAGLPNAIEQYASIFEFSKNC